MIAPFWLRAALALLCSCGIEAGAAALPLTDPAVAQTPVALIENFTREVRPFLTIPEPDSRAYAGQLQAALDDGRIEVISQQFIVLVDRNPHVQALLLFWGRPGSGWHLIGATPVSTGLPGKFEHFLTPLGVFEHSRENPDFRATGTKNKLGIRGYGAIGSRIYDFGWVKSVRGWGNGGAGELRFQMHSTDADRLEQRLGTAQSEGCVRIPAALNAFIDHYGLLDEDYDRVVAAGTHLRILRADRAPTAWPGRYLVVVESAGEIRPDWSPAPLVGRGTGVPAIPAKTRTLR